MQSTKSNICPS